MAVPPAAPQPSPAVFALDVGVPPVGGGGRSSGLGWAGPGSQFGTRLSRVARSRANPLLPALAGALEQRPVHLYLEAPLFLPADPADSATSEADLCAMRPFEHAGVLPPWVVGTTWPTGRAWPWTSNAGGAALGMGLQELSWLLAQIQPRSGGHTLTVNTCPPPGCCSSASTGPWQLTILEAFHPGQGYPRTGPSHRLSLPEDASHTDVAKRICDVVAHFGSTPNAPLKCPCHTKAAEGSVWYDSGQFPPGAGTFNLVALACLAAGVANRPAPNAHGWVLCA